MGAPWRYAWTIWPKNGSTITPRLQCYLPRHTKENPFDGSNDDCFGDGLKAPSELKNIFGTDLYSSLIYIYKDEGFVWDDVKTQFLNRCRDFNPSSYSYNWRNYGLSPPEPHMYKV